MSAGREGPASPESTDGRPIYDHPPVGFLLGGLPAIGAVRYGYVPGSLPLWLAGGLLILTVGVVMLLASRRLHFPALVCFGFGVFVLLTLLAWKPYALRRDRLLNHRVHVSGRFFPPDRLEVTRLNRQSFTGSFYLPAWVARQSLDSGSSESSAARRRIAVTATVRWPFDSEGFANYLAANRYIGTLDALEVHSGGTRGPPGVEGSEKGGLYRSLRQGLVVREDRWPLSSAFLRALLLGERDALPRRVETILRRLGTSHLFVISGLHVGLLFFVLLYGTRRFNLSPGWTVLVTGVALVGYLTFIGWPISATRAGLMVLLLLVTNRGLRRCSVREVLLSTVLLLLLYDPLMMFRVGFQLSVAAVSGIVLIDETVESRLFSPGLRWLMMNLGAYLAVMPLLLFHFNMAPLWGWLSSFVAGLIFPVFLLLLGLQGILLGIDWTVPAGLIEFVFQACVESLGTVVGGYSLTVGVAGMSLLTVLVYWVFLWASLDENRSTWIRGCGVLGVGFLLVALLTETPVSVVEMSLVDGMGVAYVQTAQGRHLVMLDPRTPPDTGRIRKLQRLLRQRGISYLDGLVGSVSCGRLSRTGITLTVRGCRAPHDGQGRLRWPGLSADPGRGILRTSTVTVRWNTRPSSEPFRGTPLLARVNERYCLMRANRGTRDAPSPNCRRINLKESPIVWYEGQSPEREPYTRQSVEARVLDLLETAATLIFGRGSFSWIHVSIV